MLERPVTDEHDWEAEVVGDSVNDLLRALLTRGVPGSLQSHIPRTREGAYPLHLGIDDDGYPSEDKVEEIRLVSFRDAPRWLHDEFPRLWRSLGPCARIDVSETTDLMDLPALKFYVATGGWSGCESVIYAVLGHPILSSYCRERRSGGGYTFVIAHKHGKENEDA